MLALMGQVPMKATTENGSIRPGDLLTLSSKTGLCYILCGVKRCEGAIIGKALEGLAEGEELIMVLLMAH